MEIAFSEDSVRELNRMMYTMFKFFNYALSNSPKKDYRDFKPEDAIHLQLRPSDYYNLQIGTNSVSIYQIRTHYTLKLCGFTTKLYPSYKKSSDFKYVNCFGDFADFESAKFAFYQVCKEYLDLNVGALF